MAVLDPDNYTLNAYAVPTFVTAAAILMLGAAVLIRERGSRGSVAFFFMALAGAVWFFGFSWMYCAVDEGVALWWAKAAYVGVSFIPSTIYLFSALVTSVYVRRKSLVRAGWSLSTLFSAAALGSDALISAVYPAWWGYYPRYGWLGIPYLAFFLSMMALSMGNFWAAYKKADAGTHRRRLKSFMIAFAIAYLASVDFLAKYAFPFYPIGYLAVLGFALITARAIWRYRLVDITPAFAAREIINVVADALLVLDRDGVVRVVNPAACQLLGKSEVELVGTPITTVAGAIPDGQALAARILNGAIGDQDVAVPLRRGGMTLLSLSSFVMRDQARQPVAFVCLLRDITERKKAEDQIQRGLQRLAALHEINIAITSTLDLQSVLNLLLEKIDLLVPYSPTTAIRLFNGETKTLELVASRNLAEAEWTGDRWKSGRDLAGLVFESRAPLLIRNIQNNPGIENREFYRKHGFISYLGVPLTAKDEALGVLSFYTKGERPFAEEEVEFLTTLAGQAAIAIHHSQLFERIKKQPFVPDKENRESE
ncbi:MAG: GAF domain-containing protein [Deltaproteobacteria bacterium]|nr:GAF domain-containing protein [Deltaproteobacteria bacterium]